MAHTACYTYSSMWELVPSSIHRSKPHPAGNLDNDADSSHSHMTMSENFEDELRKSVLPDSPDSSGTLEGRLIYSPQTNV